MRALLAALLLTLGAGADEKDTAALHSLAADLNRLSPPSRDGDLSIWMEVSGPRADKVRKTASDLIRSLAARDHGPVDLVIVGKKLTTKNGPLVAYLAVHVAWAMLTPAHENYVNDVMWLSSQPPRVRDVAWLLKFSEEWCP